MVQLGQFFYNEGDDSEKAFYWLQHAAGKGDITAQATIGVMYKTGEGVKEQSIEKVSKKPASLLTRLSCTHLVQPFAPNDLNVMTFKMARL